MHGKNYLQFSPTANGAAVPRWILWSKKIEKPYNIYILADTIHVILQFSFNFFSLSFDVLHKSQ